MKNENAEMISNRVRELIEAGKQKGALTIKEIIEQFADCEMEPDQFDKILDTLSELNIEIIKENTVSEADPAPGAGRPSRRPDAARGHLHRRSRCACI